MKYYLLMTARQWQELQKPQEDNSIFRRSPLVPSSIVDYKQLKPVRYDYSSQMDEIVKHCVKYQDECRNLYSTLETLGLYYGRNTYNKDDKKFTAALKEALGSQRAILIEIPVESHSGLLPPENNFLKLPSHRISRRLTASEVQARQLARYDNEDNYIEFTVHNLADQPFTIFDNASQKMLKQGKLDSSGYAYVSLPVNAQYVDIVFDKQQTDRPWYYDVPLQLLGGMRDAAQSVADLAWDASIAKQLIQHNAGVELSNSVQLLKVPEAETVSGALAHGVSQFLVGFIPASKVLKFIKPLTRMGKLSQSMIAGGVTDFAVFAPHEERLSNLVQSFDALQNPVTEYLQASPDDSAAEGRLKNALEGLLLGALTEPFAHSLRAFKYARIKWMVPDVKTQVHYKLEALPPDVKEINLTDGALRASKYSDNWTIASLDDAIKKFAGDNPKITVTDTGKKIYKNQNTGIEIVEDLKGNYFRIYDPSITGKRAYLDMNGNIPNNKVLDDGKNIGRTQSEYNQVTHFNIKKGE